MIKLVKMTKQVINPFEEARKERLQWVIGFMSSQELPINSRKITSLIELKYGVSQKTAKDYIRVAMIQLELVRSGFIIDKEVPEAD